jgi:hypothetical protein
MRAPIEVAIQAFRLNGPTRYGFGFSAAKKEEMAALLTRYGTTTTGIGRIMIQMGRDRLWREAQQLPGPAQVHVSGEMRNETAHEPSVEAPIA